MRQPLRAMQERRFEARGAPSCTSASKKRLEQLVRPPVAVPHADASAALELSHSKIEVPVLPWNYRNQNSKSPCSKDELVHSRALCPASSERSLSPRSLGAVGPHGPGVWGPWGRFPDRVAVSQNANSWVEDLNGTHGKVLSSSACPLPGIRQCTETTKNDILCQSSPVIPHCHTGRQGRFFCLHHFSLPAQSLHPP